MCTYVGIQYVQLPLLTFELTLYGNCPARFHTEALKSSLHAFPSKMLC